MVAGLFVRPIADDYCTAEVALREGVWGSVLYWYNGWGGQFINWIIKGIGAYLGTAYLALLPTVLMISLVAALYWALLPVLRGLQVSQPRLLALLMSLVFVVAHITTVPNTVQSYFWMGAIVPYALPLVILLLLIGIILRQLRSSNTSAKTLLLVMALAFTGGGLSEVYSVFQLFVFGVGVLASLIVLRPPLRNRILMLCLAGAVAGFIALLIIALAPGNDVRAARFAERSPLFEAIGRALFVAIAYIPTAIMIHGPWQMLGVFAVSGLLSYHFLNPGRSYGRLRRNIRIALVLSAFLGIGMVFASVFPSLYAMSVAPPARHYTITQFGLLVIAAVWGCAMGLGLKRKPGDSLNTLQSPLAKAGVVILLVLVAANALSASAEAVSLISDLSVYAREWDANAETIAQARARGETEVTIPAFTRDMAILANLDTVAAGSDGAASSCVNAFFGVERIVIQ